MFLRSQHAYPATEITITLVNSKNKRFRMTFSSNDRVQKLFQKAFELRLPEYADVTFENYVRATNLSFQGVKLTNLNATLAISNISNSSVIRETFKKWIKGTNVDKKTLTITDPIYLTPIEDKPYILDCNHVGSRDSLTRWITQCLTERKAPDCPCCRAPIDDTHIDKLVPVRPVPAPLPLAIPLQLMIMLDLLANLPPPPGRGPQGPVRLPFVLFQPDQLDEGDIPHPFAIMAPQMLFGPSADISEGDVPSEANDVEDERSSSSSSPPPSRKRKREDDEEKEDKNRPSPGNRR